jgi:hypothetical protein
MDRQKIKMQQRIDRRKRKVQRMIGEQEIRLNALDSVTYLRRADYLRDLQTVRGKLYRLKQELQALESGILRWEK